MSAPALNAINDAGSLLAPLLDASPVGMALVDLQGNVVRCNQAFSQQMGLSAELCRNTPVSQLLPDLGTPQSWLDYLAPPGVHAGPPGGVLRASAHWTVTLVRSGQDEITAFGLCASGLPPATPDPSSKARSLDPEVATVVLDGLPMGLTVADAGGTLLYQNAALENLDRGTAASPGVVSPRSLVDALDSTPTRRLGGESASGQLLSLEHDDEGASSFEVLGTALPDSAEVPSITVATASNHLDGAQETEALRETNERLSEMVGGITDAFFALNHAGRFSYVNTQAVLLLDRAASELIGREIWDALPEYRGQPFAEAVEAALAHGIPSRTELEFRQPRRWLDAHVYPTSGGALVFYSDITHRKRAESALLASEARFQAFMENIPAAAWVKDAEGRYLYANRGWADFARLTPDQVRGRTDAEVFAADRAAAFRSSDLEVTSKGEMQVGEEQVTAPDGQPRSWLRFCFPVPDESGGVGAAGIALDVTERRRLEGLLNQSQKMEAVGRLAGGIAHDFNNMLAVINGYSSLLLPHAVENRLVRQGLEAILAAGERAASLTQQLLAFSRQQVVRPRALCLSEVVEGMASMLQRLVGEDVQLVTLLDPQLGTVTADSSQMEQILLNLAVNARDAMPLGGRLTVECRNMHLDESFRWRHGVVKTGAYVQLSVTDNGSGMTPEVMERIFEPFFTTKEPGSGTGLGLATVFGIVQQSEGYIWTYSEPGLGTTFKIYLPRTDVKPTEETNANGRSGAYLGSETILVVEDEALVRDLVRDILSAAGYRVLTAASGREAEALLEAEPQKVDLLLTDVVMPEVSGRELAERLQARFPGLCVVYMSGYTDDAVIRHGVLLADVAFLQKPFSPSALTRKVRETLDACGGG